MELLQGLDTYGNMQGGEANSSLEIEQQEKQGCWDMNIEVLSPVAN